MLLKDINLDEFNNTVLTGENSITTDTLNAQLRNYLLRLKKNQDFWKPLYNYKIKKRILFEGYVEEYISKNIKPEINQFINIIALLFGRRLTIYFFEKTDDPTKKDKLIFDFDIYI